MVQSIELLLDDDADAAVRTSWAALHAAGLPSLATHTGETNAPHVTVAVTDGSGFSAAASVLRTIEADIDLTIGAPILFGGHRGRWVLARQVVPSRRLLELHAAVHRALDGVDMIDHTAPDAWTPHVTLAHRVPVEDLPAALAVIDVEPIACRVVGMRLWSSPTKTVTSLFS